MAIWRLDIKCLSKGIRWFFKFDLSGVLYRSKAIYLSKAEAKSEEAKAYQKAERNKRHSDKPQEITLLQAMTERLDYIQVRKTKKYYNDNKRYFYIQLIDRCSPEQKNLILFLMETGCRINEALKVTGSDIVGDYIVLTTRKSSNSDLIPRKLPLPDFLKDFHFNSDERIFASWTEQPKFLERKVKSLGQKEWGFHSLRHRKASIWSKEGKPLFEIMILLGHKNISTTQKYLQLIQ